MEGNTASHSAASQQLSLELLEDNTTSPSTESQQLPAESLEEQYVSTPLSNPELHIYLEQEVWEVGEYWNPRKLLDAIVRTQKNNLKHLAIRIDSETDGHWGRWFKPAVSIRHFRDFSRLTHLDIHWEILQTSILKNIEYPPDKYIRSFAETLPSSVEVVRLIGGSPPNPGFFYESLRGIPGERRRLRHLRIICLQYYGSWRGRFRYTETELNMALLASELRDVGVDLQVHSFDALVGPMWQGSIFDM